jgi:O-acetyl-ADP-ribose deacetylase (regulator of RNase III)
VSICVGFGAERVFHVAAREVGMRIITIQGDITQVDVDAVFVPVDAGPGLRRRVEDRLLQHAGNEVEAETAARGPLRVGEAMLTSGGKLRCRYVIQAPLGAQRPTDAEGVKMSTLAALRCAAGSRLRSVAIPAFPRGEQATGALVSALMDFNQEGGLEEIFIVGQGEIVCAIKRKIASEN